MHRPRARLRFRVVLLGALAAGLAAGAAAAPALALTVGIADNKPDMFGDARFHAAGVRFARLSIGWANSPEVGGRQSRRLAMIATRLATGRGGSTIVNQGTAHVLDSIVSQPTDGLRPQHVHPRPAASIPRSDHRFGACTVVKGHQWYPASGPRPKTKQSVLLPPG